VRGLLKVKNNPASCRCVVVGSGKSGFAALKFLHSKGCHVFLSEKGEKEDLDADLLHWMSAEKIDFEVGGHSEKVFVGADLIVVSPGVPLSIKALQQAREKNTEIIGEFGLAAAFIDIPMVAVTGTNGKTTVTELIGTLFEASGKKVFVGGNIGTPLTDYLLGSEKAEVAVVEVSSYQLDTAGEFAPQVAVLLNISPDHLDRYDSYEAYADSKIRIFSKQKETDAAVINGDDALVVERLSKKRCQAKRYEFAGQNDMAEARLAADGKMFVNVGDGEERYALPLCLQHAPNRENAMAAIIAARLGGCRKEAINEGLLNFSPLEHRVTPVAEIDGVSYFDDSKATNIGAVQSALTGMDKPVILIAGGKDKGGDYRLLADIVRRKVKKMVLIGEAREKIAVALAGEAPVETAETLEGAVRKAAEVAEAGDAVLLSPACASFDMFNNYAERGRVFQQAVRKLGIRN